MFAHEIILEKSGPLARVWLAAHWDKKLKKKDIFETKLIESVDNIINPKMKLALRTSGHLLLGVVKIYNRKTGFLYTDCNEAIIKLRSAFRPDQKEMTVKENKTKKDDKKLFLSNIDLGDMDDKLPDINDLDLDKNRARLEEITLREENDFLNADELGLGDTDAYQEDLAIDFNNEEMMRDLTEVFGEHQLDLGGHDTNFLGDDASEMGDDHTFGGSPPEIDQDLEAPGNHVEEYHNPMSVHMMEDTIDDSPMSPPARPPRPDTADSILDSQPPTPITVNFGSIQEPMTPGGMSQHSIDERPEQPPTPMYHDSMPPSPMPHPGLQTPVMSSTMMHHPQAPSPAHSMHSIPQSPQQQQAQRMQLRDRRPERPQSTRSFVLEPTEHITPKGGRRKIRRQLTIDQAIGIDAETMRSQLRDHDDIVGRSVMAPPVEKILRSKEDTSVDKLFMLPISSIHTGLHQSCFISNCRPDLPACANARIEQANVDSYNTHLYMDQQQNLDRSHDSDDDGYDYEDQYSHGGPPSVQSYYEEERRDQHQNSQQNISQQDDQWDRAVNQMPNDQTNINNMSIQAGDFTLGSSLNTENSMMHQKPPQSPAMHDNLSMPPTPQNNWGTSAEVLSAAPSPMPMPESPAAPSPAPSMGLPEPQTDLPHEPIQPQIIPQPEPSSSDSSNYEPEPKRMRTASAEADFQEVEAGKGTPACIKLTQRLLMENNAVSLNQMAFGNSRKLAAQKFYSSLVMLKHEVIEAQQNEPFGDVIITKGSNFGAEILDHC